MAIAIGFRLIVINRALKATFAISDIIFKRVDNALIMLGML